MINCSDASRDAILLELGADHIPWRQDMAFAQFMEDAFPKTDHPNLNGKDSSAVSTEIKASICAKRLKRIAGLRFQATDDLRNHLKLDQKEGIVEIYHHTAVIKEHLNASRNAVRSAAVEDSITL